MEDKDIIQQEENKVQDFITKIESGNTTTDNSRNNQEAIRKFLMDQRLRYADAANRASKISPYSYEYAEHSQTMNDIKASISNLATQKTALLQAQGSFISDYENGLISKANTAQNILDMSNKVYQAGKQMNPQLQQLITASIKEQLAKGGRNTLMSLWTDNLVPGLDYKSIDKSYFKPENTEQLFNLTVDKLSNGIAQVSNEGYNAKEAEKARKAAARSGGRSTSSGTPRTATQGATNTTGIWDKKSPALVNALKTKSTVAIPVKGAKGEFLRWRADGSEIVVVDAGRNPIKDEQGRLTTFKTPEEAAIYAGYLK